MKHNSFPRRGMLIGSAATLSAAHAIGANSEDNDSQRAITQDVNGAVIAPPYAYVGCYTGGSNARGIGVFHYEPATTALSLISIVAPVSSPSFIVLDAAKKFLYSGNESGGGSCSAFSVNSRTGALRSLNTQGAGGQPAHIMIHPNGKYLLSANYTGGTVAVFPIQADGSLGSATQIVSHFGDLGPNSGRQEAPHPHMVLVDSTGKYVLVNDLGLDAVIVYAFDTESGKLTEINRIDAKPGSGPRHLAWHPNGRVVYSIHEFSNSITTYNWFASSGDLNTVQEASTLPSGFKGNSACAEVLVDKEGKFLYASNRGNDSIAIFSIDPTVFTLTLLGLVHTQGRTPRHFNFDPTGNFILSANQDSANIVAYKIDKTTGMISPAGQYASYPAPTCIQFA